MGNQTVDKPLKLWKPMVTHILTNIFFCLYSHK